MYFTYCNKQYKYVYQTEGIPDVAITNIASPHAISSPWLAQSDVTQAGSYNGKKLAASSPPEMSFVNNSQIQLQLWMKAFSKFQQVLRTKSLLLLLEMKFFHKL